MRNPLHRCLTLCCLSLLVCTAARAQLQKIYINPKATGFEKQSQIIDSIRFIPLQVKEDVDLDRFNYVAVTANHFLIIDYAARNILIYAKQGAFLNKVSYNELGEGLSPDYDEYNDRLVFFGDNKNYALTPKDRVQIMLDWNNPRNKKYFKKYIIDLKDPSFTIKRVTPDEHDILRANHFEKDYYWLGRITTSDLYKDSLDHELKFYRNNQLVKEYFPYNHITEPKFLFAEESISINRTPDPDIHFVSRPYCDTIYRMFKDSLMPVYQLVLPLENSLPASFYNKPFKNKTDRENFSRNNGWMLHQIHNIYETPNFLLFAVRYLTNFEAYIYEKKNKTCYKLKNIRTDTSQYNLALLQDMGMQRQGDRFYRSQKAGDLQAFFASHKEIAVPGELETFFNSKPNNGSPVLVEFKIKN